MHAASITWQKESMDRDAVRALNLGLLLGDTTPVDEAGLRELGFAFSVYDHLYHLDQSANDGDGRGVFAMGSMTLYMRPLGKFPNVRSMGQLRCLLLGVNA